MALTLHSILPPTRSGRTFFVASCVLGFGAAVQLLVMGIFLLRGGAARHPAPATPAIAFAETAQPGVVETPAPEPPQPAAPTPAPVGPTADAAVPLPEGGLARPTPATAPPVGNSVASLIDQSRQLRQRGDMPSALARLREAQVSEPENPQIIAEMALTYEAMQLGDRAFEQWQRLYDMGESVGALHYLADSRLHTAPPSASAAPDAAPPGTGTQVPPGSALDALQSTSVLKITELYQQDVPDPSAEKKLVLRITVKDRPGSAIDPTKVRILTYFYDLIDGNDIVLTDAQTDFAWVTNAPINWAGDKSEVLETTYFRPKAAPGSGTPPSSPAPSAAPSPAGRAPRRGGRGGKGGDATPATAGAAPVAPVRTYLGYVVRLYYDRQLQDVQADPVRLLQKFPPPLTLPAE